MGQKSNLLTLKSFQPNINLLTFNTKVFIHLFTFLQSFERLLYLKGVWITKSTLSNTTNLVTLNLVLFFTSKKIQSLKRKKFKKKIKIFQEKIFFFISQKLRFYFKFFRNNIFYFYIKNLNKKINKKLIIIIYKKIKFFFKSFFMRRLNLYIDFIKIVGLLYQNLIDSKIFLLAIGLIFKNIFKRVHLRFCSFLEDLFNFIIYEVPKKIRKSSNILGIKFSISGRLQGKARATYQCIQKGCVPLQSFSKNIEFSKMHIYTFLGAFGLKIWLYKKK